MAKPKPAAPARTGQPRLRCAVYTRKSTEEGLEQELQLPRCPARGLRGLHQRASATRAGSCCPTATTMAASPAARMERPALQALLADIAAGRIDVDRGLQGRPADPRARRLRQDRRGVRRARRVVRVGHPAVQHHHQHGPADAERAAVLRPVRARGHRRAHPRQDRRVQAQGHVDGRPAAARLRRGRPQARGRTRPRPRRCG